MLSHYSPPGYTLCLPIRDTRTARLGYGHHEQGTGFHREFGAGLARERDEAQTRPDHVDAHLSKNLLPTFFLESWIYSGALNVMKHCEAWATNIQLDAPQLAAFNPRRGELFELARSQEGYLCSPQYEL